MTIGRPRKAESERVQVRAKTFFYPSNDKRWEIVWKEFENVSKRTCDGNDPNFYRVYSERRTAYMLRIIIMSFVYQGTNKEDVKEIIKQIREEEYNYNKQKFKEKNK